MRKPDRWINYCYCRRRCRLRYWAKSVPLANHRPASVVDVSTGGAVVVAGSGYLPRPDLLLLLGTPPLSLLGAIGEALTLVVRRLGVLLSLLLPLFIPVLIFATSTVDNAASGLPVDVYLTVLDALFAGSVILAPFANAAALGSAQRDGRRAMHITLLRRYPDKGFALLIVRNNYHVESASSVGQTGTSIPNLRAVSAQARPCCGYHVVLLGWNWGFGFAPPDY